MSPRKLLGERIRRFTASVLVLMYTLVATLGVSFVVCAEPDGHVAIEWRGASCCTDESSSSQSRPHTAGDESTVSAGAQDETGSCRDCVDESASGRFTSRSAAAARAPSVPSPDELPSAAWATCVSSAWLDVARVSVASPGPSPPPPPQLRTFVLRC